MDQTVPAYAAEVADYGRSRDPEPGEGALVKNVRPESPAWDVGIEPGMRVLAVNGEQLTDMIVWLWEADDDTVELEVFDPRDGTVTPVELDRFPGEDWGLEFDGPIFDGMRTCVNACVFCFMTMLPKGGRSTLYIRDDDYRLSFLQGNFVTLTNLSDEDVQNVIDRNMSPMNVSVHAVSPDVRRRMMGRNAQRGMDVLEAIMAAGIEIHAQIVLCPGMNDGEELLKTLRFCEDHEQITSLGIVPLGFTKHQNRFSWSYSDKPELARETIAMIRPFQDRAFERFGRHTFQMSDEFYLDAGIGAARGRLLRRLPAVLRRHRHDPLVSGRDRQRARRRCRAPDPRSRGNRRPWSALTVPFGRQRARYGRALCGIAARPRRHRHSHQKPLLWRQRGCDRPYRRLRHLGAAATRPVGGYALCA